MGDPTKKGTLSEEHFHTALRILESGKNVVSSLAPPTHFKHFRDPDYFINSIEHACQIGGSSIHFTGIDPGFFSDSLAMNIASGVGEVNQIRTWEILDYSTVPAIYETGQREMGFGLRPGEAAYEKKLRTVRDVWGGVPHLLTEATGLKLDDTRINIEYVTTDKTFVTKGGIRIEEGCISSIKFSVESIVEGATVFITNHVNRMRAEDAPHWPTIPNSGGGGYRIEIDGSTNIRVDFPLGRPGEPGSAIPDTLEITASRLVNCIGPVVEAEPGFRRFFELKTPLATNIVPKNPASLKTNK